MWHMNRCSVIKPYACTCTSIVSHCLELWCLSGGKRGDYQNCSVLYCVLKLCTVIKHTYRWAILITVLSTEFCHTGPISLCIDLFVFVNFVFFCQLLMCRIIMSAVGWTRGPSVLWHCWLGHLTLKNQSRVWPMMCLMDVQSVSHTVSSRRSSLPPFCSVGELKFSPPLCRTTTGYFWLVIVFVIVINRIIYYIFII